LRALIQRVTRARCTARGRLTGEIGRGLLVLLGAAVGDGADDADWLARKVAGLRVFEDDAAHMNRDVLEAGGGALVIPQFTLYGDARRGRRPDFVRAARPEAAEPLYERFCATLAAAGVPVARGAFREHMQIELVNDGPVTLMIESPARAPAGAGHDASTDLAEPGTSASGSAGA
jgi:D-tyrosyl-tRNA(Tyr) deacylase